MDDHPRATEERTVAAFDVGTNSVLLLVARVSEGDIASVLLDEERMPRLGHGVGRDGVLANDAISRTVDAIIELRTLAERLGIQVWRAAATSAARDAPNKGALIADVELRAGITLDVIDGSREAALSFRGVSSDPLTPAGPLIVVDIGGGSTEYMWGERNTVAVATSVDIGSNRLQHEVTSLDPVPRDGVERMREKARAALRGALGSELPPSGATLMLVGGTANTLLAIEQGAGSPTDRPRLTHARLEHWLHVFATSTASERSRLPGMPPARVDTIVTGTAILLEMCHALGVESALVSHRGLRYGLALTS